MSESADPKPLRIPLRDDLASKAVASANAWMSIDDDDPDPIIGFIEGSGLTGLFQLTDERSVPIRAVNGFKQAEQHPTHTRVLSQGMWGNILARGMRGRFHIGDRSADPDGFNRPDHHVRLMVDVIIQSGVRLLVSTCAVGSLDDSTFKPGDIVVTTGFMMGEPSNWAVYSGEFKDPDEALSFEINEIAKQELARELQRLGKRQERTCGIMRHTTGPGIETYRDKVRFRNEGADFVGMSGGMEATITALYDGSMPNEHKVYHLVFGVISNPMKGKHDRKQVCQMVEASVPILRPVIINTVDAVIAKNLLD